MPNRLLLEVGQKSVEVPLRGTPTQILNMLRRYARNANLPVAPDATPEELATAILQGFKAQVIAGAKQEHVNQQMVNIRQSAEEENTL
jgi:hypothetical protein